LPDGKWFSCSNDEDMGDHNETSTAASLDQLRGWTNFSHCWTDTTRKLMSDLNVSAGCPAESSQADREVNFLLRIFFIAQGTFFCRKSFHEC
jgi:hypothetical protein